MKTIFITKLELRRLYYDEEPLIRSGVIIKVKQDMVDWWECTFNKDKL